MGVVLDVVDVEVDGVVEVPVDDGPAFFSCCLSQASNAAGDITIAWRAHERVAEAAELGALERERAEARRRDVQLRDEPGDDVLLDCENCGTKTEWMTSSERM